MIDNFDVILKERYVTCINLLCFHFASSFITAILLHPSCGAYINWGLFFLTILVQLSTYV
jgi:hypothetical protein